MKRNLSTIILVIAMFAQPAWALFPLLDHVDLRVDYSANTSEWQWRLMSEGEQSDPSQAYFPARDAVYPDGEKEFRPSGLEWDFFGVGEGEPLWIYPESSSAHSWLGFDNTSPGLQDPVHFQLMQVMGPADGQFSLYRVISGQPVVFMSTQDGVDATDQFQKPAGHHHLNWAFSQTGMWAVDLKVSAALIGGNEPTAEGPSDTKRFYFAIGEKAEWRAQQFDADTVMNEAVAGDMADPDQDGWSNLLEYAFGANPQVSGIKRANSSQSAAPALGEIAVEGERHLTLSFFRRSSTLSGVDYAVQWQSGLGADAWMTDGVEYAVETVDSTWEHVTVRDREKLGAGSRFARVRVKARDEE